MRRKLRNTRPKAFLGLTMSALGTVANILQSNESAKAQQKQLEQQLAARKSELELQRMQNETSTLNNYFANSRPEEMQYAFKRGGNIRTTGRKFRLRRGKLIPIDGNTAYLVGPSHANGGIDVDDGRAKFNAEGGEVLERRPGEDIVYSQSEDMRSDELGGLTPAEFVAANPYDDSAKAYAQSVQEARKTALIGSSPVGRIRRLAAWGDLIPTLSPSASYIASGGAVPKDSGVSYITRTSPWKIQNITGISPTTPAMPPRLNYVSAPLSAHYKAPSNSSFSDWFGGIVKPIDAGVLAANTILPIFAYSNSRANLNKQLESLGNWRKEINSIGGFARPSYISSNTDIDDTADRSEARRTAYQAALLNRRNTASANTMLDRHNILTNNYQETLNKIMGNTANRELELRNADIAARNNFNIAAMNAENEWNRSKLAAKLDFAKLESGVYDAYRDSNEGLIKAWIDSFGTFAQTASDRLRDRRLMQMALANGTPETRNYLMNNLRWLRGMV